MGKVIAGMTMSLDGFVEDENGNGGVLGSDFEELMRSDFMRKSATNTGAVVMGWKTFAMADDFDSYADTYEYQVPIFVVTHAAPERHPRESEHLTFTFVTDGVESAIKQAKAAAGSKDVTIVGGAKTIQHCLNVGLVDELQVDVMPVLLGNGLRFLDSLDTERIHLERINALAVTKERTHLAYRVTHKPNDQY